MLGYPAQARQASQEALTLVQEISHAPSFAFASAFAAGLHFQCRDYPLAQEYAEATISLAAEHGFTYWHAKANIFCGGALAAQGQPTQGIGLIQQGIEAHQTTGTDLWQPYSLGLLAEAHGKVEQTDEGLSAVAEALARVNKTQERWCEAELYRLRGELLLQQSQEPQAGVEACFRRAINVARQQQAKSWELRAATSLARLWQQQDKTAEAHQLLSKIYNWFTEGFDTADLKDAKALLKELS